MCVVVSAEYHILRDGLEEVGLDVYRFHVVVLMLKDRPPVESVLARLRHRVGILVVDTLPVASEVSLLVLDIYGQLLTR